MVITRCLSIAGALALTIAVGACGNDASKPAGSTATPGGTTPVKTDAPVFSDAMKADAQKLVDQATQYVKDNKLDLAEKSVAELEAMKPKMTPDWQGRVDQVRAALDAAKKTGALKNGEVPQMPAIK